MSPLRIIIIIIICFLSSLALALALALSQPQGTFIDCGATAPSVVHGPKWLTDDRFVSAGLPRSVSVNVTLRFLSTVRSFPRIPGRKFCYVVPVFRGARYLIRTTYFYGGVNGRSSPFPPVFDQIVDGTLWTVANTTEDYAKGLSSYYEGVFQAKGKTISVCLGVNNFTDSDPFISALEFVLLGASVYNSTDFGSHALSLVARHSFGHRETFIRYPDDPYDRIWEPYEKDAFVLTSSRTVPVTGFWNQPPSRVFERALSTAQSDTLEVRWPPAPLVNSSYYIALYFADNHYSPLASSRMMNISINGIRYYGNLNVTPEGAAVFAAKWRLRGSAKIILTPAANSNTSPLINAGEIFHVLEVANTTLTRDVIAIELVKNSLQNSPVDWNGDPCMPSQYRWTGVACSEGPRIRIISLNLTGMSLSGSLSPGIGKLTALSSILLGKNNLTGNIPNLTSLKSLQKLHLEDNQFSGKIPASLGDIKRLQELYLQNNNLTGTVPASLNKPGLDLRTSGNQFLSPSSS